MINMLNKNLLKEAHKITKEIKKEYPEVNYKAQLGICISFLYNKEVKGMVELKGTEKQVRWAEEIRKEMLDTKNIEMALNKFGSHKSEKVQAVLSILKNFRKRVNTETSAKWFIENKGLVHSVLSNGYDGHEFSLTGIVESVGDNEDYEKIARNIDKRLHY